MHQDCLISEESRFVRVDILCRHQNTSGQPRKGKRSRTRCQDREEHKNMTKSELNLSYCQEESCEDNSQA